jgi:cystathionine gamma-synthase
VSAEVRKRLGIADGLHRFSVGIEHADALLADLEQAMEKGRKGLSGAERRNRSLGDRQGSPHGGLI